MRLWDIEAERCLQVFEGHKDGIYDVAFDGSQRRALSGSRDTTVRLWDLKSGRCLRVLEERGWESSSVVFTRYPSVGPGDRAVFAHLSGAHGDDPERGLECRSAASPLGLA